MLQSQFPILNRKINGRKLVYLDNAATTQKPKAVIEAISNFYKRHNANIHRGIHTLSQEATELYEEVRDKIQKFINARFREEIIFTSGATEAINLVAWTWGYKNIHRQDEILLTEMEHHSNLVPWQMLAKKKGARLSFIPIITPLPRRGERLGERSNHWYSLDLSKLDKLITKRTKIVAITHISNVLGTINPIEKIIKVAHEKGAVVLVDGAQAVAHLPIDVQKIGCDFYVFSGHKMYGPTGVGVLYARKEILEKMPPYQVGGDMIKQVNFQSSTWNDLPYKFEAGTAPIAEVVGLGAAIDFLTPLIHNSPFAPSYPPRRRGEGELLKYELELTNYALSKLKQIRALTIYGPQNAKDRTGVISFNIAGIPPHDLASLLDEQGIAIRAGHHCAMPLHQKLGTEATARVSLGIYNTKKDIDLLVCGINQAIKVFNS